MNQSSSVQKITNMSDVAPLMRDFALHGIRSIDIFSHQLNPAVYDNAELIEAISALIRRSRQSRIRVLIRNPSSLYGYDHSLLSLIQRLPSRAYIRAYSEGAKDRFFGFFCVDKKHLIYFNDEAMWQGFARYNAQAESKHLLNEFEHLWLYGSTEDPNFRTLNI